MNPPTLPRAPRLVVFGLGRRATVDDLRPLLGAWHASEIEIVVIAADDAIAIVELPAVDRMLAWRLADCLGRRRLHGRRLQPWIPVMSWRR